MSPKCRFGTRGVLLFVCLTGCSESTQTKANQPKDDGGAGGTSGASATGSKTLTGGSTNAPTNSQGGLAIAGANNSGSTITATGGSVSIGIGGAPALAIGGASANVTSAGSGNAATTTTGGMSASGSSNSSTGGKAVGGAGGSSTGTKAAGGATGGTAGNKATGGNPSGTGGAIAGSPATGGNSTGGAATAGNSSVATGNPDGKCAIPAEAGLASTTAGTQHVVGSGTPASCTGDAFIAAVALGGVITFDCGPNPVTITLSKPAKIFNDTTAEIVIDGGGKVTLSGGGTTRILYMNTCDEAQHWTSAQCQNQDSPHLTVQNLTFVDANSKGETTYDGGGAIWVRGGRFKVVNCRFFNNVCADTGQDVGGGAIRVFSQYEGRPVYVVNSTFGGKEGLGNSGSNGGGVSSIGVSWTILNSAFSYNQAVGNGGNPASTGTPGGGSGGAIYNDGNKMTLSLCGTLIENNTVKAFGGAIFFVSNDHTGDMVITDSTIRNNPGGSWYPKYPGLSHHEDTPVVVTNSTITQ